MMSISAPPSDLLAPPATPAAADWITELPTGCYPELKRRIRAAGLLETQPRYYTLKFVATLLLAVPSLALLLLTRNPFVQALNALYLAAVFAQFGFLGHDVGHRQVIRSGPAGTTLRLLVGPLLVGVSSSWWIGKHNQHHGHPNREGYDPDVTLPIVAFSGRRARMMNRAQRAVVRHQHRLLPLLLMFEGIVLRVSGIGHLVARRGRRWLPELLLVALHIGLYGWLVFHALGPWTGLLFVCINQAAFGLYMGSVFAPNHKGMPVLDDDAPADFLLEQVITSRNVRGGRAVDFLFGGLNYQIEHHLFPIMPRNRLRQAQPIVVAFCAERGIPYCQTSALQSYRLVFGHLRAVAAVAAAPVA